MSDTVTLSTDEIKAMRDFVNLGQALVSSLSSTQISRFASTLGEVLPLLQSLANPDVMRLVKVVAESAGSLAELIQLVTEYHKSGRIQQALELVTLVGVVKDALSSGSISGMARLTNDALVTVHQLATQLGGIEKLQELVNSTRAYE